MSVETALQQLWARLHELRDGLVALRLTAVEDRPLEGRTALSDRLADEAEELASSVEEALHAVAGALDSHEDVRHVRAALMTSHRQVGHAAHRFWVSLGEEGRQLELVRLGRRGGSAWRDWVRSILAAAEPCATALTNADAAVRRAWGELVERAAATPVRVETTAIGQHVTVHRAEHRADAVSATTRTGNEEDAT